MTNAISLKMLFAVHKFGVVVLLLLNFINASSLARVRENGLRRKRFVGDHHGFNYNRASDYGPYNWGHHWHWCQGRYQSPIDLDEDQATYYDFLPNYTVKEGGSFKGSFKNNGHAPVFEFDTSPSTLSGFPRDSSKEPADTFNLVQFHFHFACAPDGGSEHTMNGRHYDVEMHMVHYNAKYSSLSEALDKPDGLAVLGVFLQGQDVAFSPLDRFIIAHAQHIRYKEENGFPAEFNPFLVFDGNQTEAFSYKGSLTTPACYETVQWMVLKNPASIHVHSVEIFQKMFKENNGELIVNYGNCRPLMPLMQRFLYVNFDV